MNTMVIADKVENLLDIRLIFTEYLDWAITNVNREYGTDFSITTLIEQDMLTLDKFMPPEGRILLSFDENNPAGVVCLKRLNEKEGEIKRMYVRPQFRKQGIGRALVQCVIAESLLIGYEKLKLDSARFMVDAHALYQSMGFHEIGPYEGSEIPKQFQNHWKFMELNLP